MFGMVTNCEMLTIKIVVVAMKWLISQTIKNVPSAIGRFPSVLSISHWLGEEAGKIRFRRFPSSA
jgi:hypothetical protein